MNLSSLLLLAFAASRATAFVPAPRDHKSSFSVPTIRSGEYLNSQNVSSSPFSFSRPALAFSRRAASNPVEIAKAYLKTLAPDAELSGNRDHYTDPDTGITHVYFTQTLNGLKIENAQANVNILRNGTVLSAGNSLVKGKILAPALVAKRAPTLDAVEALKKVVEKKGYPLKTEKAYSIVETSFDGGEMVISLAGVEGTVGDPKAKKVYYATEDGVRLAWRIDTDLDDSYMVTYIDAEDTNILGAIDWVAHADYNVLPLGTNDPTDGPRVTLRDPWNTAASPNGWHQTSRLQKYTTTRGNNVIAQENLSGGETYLLNDRPNGGTNLRFDFPYNTSMESPNDYLSASVTQLFYMSNIYHDLLEDLGFTEAAGNFEAVNTGLGGLGGDAVQVNAHDGSGYNNANFRTTPDGQVTKTPRMRMYLWMSDSGPIRDGSFESGIVIHEYTHGLSNRLTGGPRNVECLTTMEAGGMGEGWGDFFATALRIKSTDTRTKDYGMGDWCAGAPVRNYLYSTSMTTNPSTFSWIGKDDEWSMIHTIGNYWANVLYEMMWNLEDKHGYRVDPFPEFQQGTKVPKHGRHLAMKLVLEAMKLQPCNPTILDARDAIIDADKALTNGANKCEIWKAFAKRGLGSDARTTGIGSLLRRVDGFSLPLGC